MEPTHPAAYGASDSLAVLRHRWWLVALVTGLGLAAAGGWLHARPPVWESATSVLVHPAGQDANVVGGRTQGEVNLDTEAQLVRSTAVAAGAAELLGLDPAPTDLARRVGVTVPPNTSVLTITFTAATPAEAQAGAQAFAEAYLDHRAQSARADLAAQAEAIEAMLDELGGRLADLNQRLAQTATSTAAAVNLDSQRGMVASQMNSLTDRLNALTTATVSPGTVISEARLPEQPSRPEPAVVLASGAALGLVAGLGAAGLGERLARRVRRPTDLPRRLGVPVLAAFTAANRPPAEEIASPYAPAGRTFDRLRNEVIASERSSGASDAVGFTTSERSSRASDAVGFTASERSSGASDAAAGQPVGTGRGRVIVVTSPTGGPATGPVAGLVATNLAASMSRCGHDTVLVEAAAPGTAGSLTRLLGVAAAPGLSEVLAGRTSLADALQRPARYPRLQVMTMGGTATATGLLQSPALRTVLAALTTQAGYVVVEAPATAMSADAQSLAGHADLALLAVEARRTRLADVVDAAAQLRQVATPLLGAVVVPPRRREVARRGTRPGTPDGGDGQPAARSDRPGPQANPTARPRGTEPPAPAPRQADHRQADHRHALGATDGQTLVIAGLSDHREAGDFGQPDPPDPPQPLEPSEPPERPEQPGHP
ncbi:MAG: lipopolysaccharide biosynthesis protein [Micromonosporaceae bacterium]|nr:lipopolysaccharide biosynthesis protein [Micromonosporaceae bacterium]